jgi:uncharacterized membrane protein
MLAVNTTLYRSAYPTAPYTVDTSISLTSEASTGQFQDIETIFAGVSVLVGCLALIVGLLQLRKYQRERSLLVQNNVYELEAGLPGVSTV